MLHHIQRQWRELQSRGLEFLMDPKEVRFAYNQKKASEININLLVFTENLLEDTVMDCVSDLSMR